jgi:hypothetical protein
VTARPLLLRLIPIALALGAFTLVSHLYGTHPVELLVTIPAELDDGKTGVDLRVLNPQGKLIVRLEENMRPAAGHTLVIGTRLPRGNFHVEGWLTSTGRRVGASLPFDGEDSVEVLLQPR